MAEQRIAQSPTPRRAKPATNQMTFPEAMQAVIDGAQITKLEWAEMEKDTYCGLHDGSLAIYRKNRWHVWKVNDGDVFGEDWIARN